MNARRLINQLVEGQAVSFEHELTFQAGDRPYQAAIEVTASFESRGLGELEVWGHHVQDEGSLALAGMTYHALSVKDDAGVEVELTPALSSALDSAFEAAYDTLSTQAYGLLD